MRFINYKKAAFFFFLTLNYLTILFKFLPEFSFDFFAALIGTSWMFWNFYAFLFNKEMLMEGTVSASKDSDTKIRRVLVLIASVVIYLMLIYSLFKK